jgi:hypothetical protein
MKTKIFTVLVIVALVALALVFAAVYVAIGDL